MFVLYLALLGLLAFTSGAGSLGLWLRKHPSKANAEKSSRILHILFFAGLGDTVSHHPLVSRSYTFG